jgi:hypothetical protein
VADVAPDPDRDLHHALRVERLQRAGELGPYRRAPELEDRLVDERLHFVTSF